MYNEYRAVIIKLIPIKIIEMFDQDNVDITRNNSPIKLIDGGNANLVRLAISHQAAISGRIVLGPGLKLVFDCGFIHSLNLLDRIIVMK